MSKWLQYTSHMSIFIPPIDTHTSSPNSDMPHPLRQPTHTACTFSCLRTQHGRTPSVHPMPSLFINQHRHPHNGTQLPSSSYLPHHHQRVITNGTDLSLLPNACANLSVAYNTFTSYHPLPPLISSISTTSVPSTNCHTPTTATDSFYMPSSSYILLTPSNLHHPTGTLHSYITFPSTSLSGTYNCS